MFYILVFILEYRLFATCFCSVTHMCTFSLPCTSRSPILDSHALHYLLSPSLWFCLSLAPGTILNIHNCPLMSMLNGCQDDLATWQNWIVFDKLRLEPEQGSKEEKSGREKRDIDPRGFFRCLVQPIRGQEQDRWSYGWAAMERSVGGRTPAVASGVKVIVTKL